MRVTPWRGKGHCTLSVPQDSGLHLYSWNAARRPSSKESHPGSPEETASSAIDQTKKHRELLEVSGQVAGS